MKAFLIIPVLLLTLLVASCTAAPQQVPNPTPVSKSAEPTPLAKVATATTVLVKSEAKSTTTSQPTPTAAAATGAPSALVTVKSSIIGAGVTSDVGVMVGIDKGYFREQGLDVQLVTFASGPELIPALATGEIDVGAGGISIGLFNAMARGIPIKIVGDKAHYPPGNAFFGITVRKDLFDSRQIKDPADLKGRTVALASLQDVPKLLLDDLLDKGGLKATDVKIVSVAYPDMIAAFSNKAIDAAIQIEPQISSAVQQGVAARWKNAGDIRPYWQGAVVLYSGKFSESKPDAARKYMAAYVKAVRDYNDAFFKNKGKAEIAAIITKYTKITQAAMDSMAMPAIKPDGSVNRDDVIKTLDDFVRQGWMKSEDRNKIDVKSVIDNSFVEYASKVLGEYK